MDLDKKISNEDTNDDGGFIFNSVFRISPEEYIKEEESAFTFSDFIRKNVEQ